MISLWPGAILSDFNFIYQSYKNMFFSPLLHWRIWIRRSCILYALPLHPLHQNHHTLSTLTSLP